MGESLTQRRRVEEEGFRIVNSCQLKTKADGLIALKLTVFFKEAPANSVPAAAVRRRGQALSGIIGRKEHVGGFLSLM